MVMARPLTDLDTDVSVDELFYTAVWVIFECR